MIEGLEGYPLGPLRDVTVNFRRTVDYQMVPHIDPPGDGPNTFILSLQSAAVLSFSPVGALRDTVDVDRIDCIVPQRTLCHFQGGARYTWTHAIRPPLSNEGDAEVYDDWGTWENVMARRPERISVVLAFADPFVEG